MAYFTRLARAIVNRSFAEEWLTKAISSSSGSAAGVNVTPDKALESSAVYACIKVLSETVASLPLQLFSKRKDGGRDLADDNPGHLLVSSEPNDFQTSYEWVEGFVAQLKMRGNAYHKIMRYGGKITQLIPYSPDKMTVEQVNGRLVYNYVHPDGQPEINIPASKMWHLKELSISSDYNGGAPEGVLGISPVTAARETLGLSLAADEYASRFFSNNASFGVAVKHPGKLSEPARKFLKDSLAEFGKLENKWKSLILEEGLDLEKLGFSNIDAQFLESRILSIEEIARIFRVPSVLIGHPNNTMTYASAEQLFLNFVIHTIRPLCVRIERSMNRFLLDATERKTLYYEFNLDGLLRGDVKARNEAFALGRKWGWWNVDEIRQKNNENPLPDGQGEVYLTGEQFGEQPAAGETNEKVV